VRLHKAATNKAVWHRARPTRKRGPRLGRECRPATWGGGLGVRRWLGRAAAHGGGEQGDVASGEASAEARICFDAGVGARWSSHMV
jgi:hypothetical protein